MNAKKALLIAIENNPEHSRFYYVLKTELLHAANKGLCKIKIPMEGKTPETISIIRRALLNDGYNTNIEHSFLTIKF